MHSEDKEANSTDDMEDIDDGYVVDRIIYNDPGEYKRKIDEHYVANNYLPCDGCEHDYATEVFAIPSMAALLKMFDKDNNSCALVDTLFYEIHEYMKSKMMLTATEKESTGQSRETHTQTGDTATLKISMLLEPTQTPTVPDKTGPTQTGPALAVRTPTVPARPVLTFMHTVKTDNQTTPVLPTHLPTMPSPIPNNATSPVLESTVEKTINVTPTAPIKNTTQKNRKRGRPKGSKCGRNKIGRKRDRKESNKSTYVIVSNGVRQRAPKIIQPRKINKTLTMQQVSTTDGIKYTEQDTRMFISMYFLSVLECPEPGEWTGRGGTIWTIIRELCLKPSMRQKVESVIKETYHNFKKGKKYTGISDLRSGRKPIIQKGSDEEKIIANWIERGASLTETTGKNYVFNSNSLSNQLTNTYHILSSLYK